MQKSIFSILLIGVFILLGTLSADAQNYQLRREVFGSGGMVASVAGSKTISGILGQLAIEKRTITSGKAVDQGFWAGYELVDVEDHTVAYSKDLYNYPNPFNSSTTIQYELPGTGMVSIKIYDMMGSLVKVLVGGDIQTGKQSAFWDGKNEAGQDVGSGSYIYELNVQPAQMAGAEGFSRYSIRNVMVLVR